MKKILLVIAALGIVAVSNAQVPGFSFGPKIGVNMSQFPSNATSVKDQLKTGYDLGVFMRLGGKCYFQPELLYATRGVTFTDVPTSNTTEIKLKSINVPLMFGARLINLKVINLRVLGGPVASFVTDKTVNYSGTVTATRELSIKDAKWGVQFGAGVDVLMFTLDVRYNYDLNKQITQNANDFKWDKQAINITLGWKLF